MTVERRDTRNIFKGNGNVRAFPFTFQVPEKFPSSEIVEDAIWIAAHDSASADQAAANYVLDGINDADQIRMIISQETSVTKFRFFPGTYIINKVIVIDSSIREGPIHLIGSGDSTLITSEDNQDMIYFSMLQKSGSIQNMKIDASNFIKAIRVSITNTIDGSFVLDNVTMLGSGAVEFYTVEFNTSYTISINNCRIDGPVFVNSFLPG